MGTRTWRDGDRATGRERWDRDRRTGPGIGMVGQKWGHGDGNEDGETGTRMGMGWDGAEHGDGGQERGHEETGTGMGTRGEGGDRGMVGRPQPGGQGQGDSDSSRDPGVGELQPPRVVMGSTGARGARGYDPAAGGTWGQREPFCGHGLQVAPASLPGGNPRDGGQGTGVGTGSAVSREVG